MHKIKCCSPKRDTLGTRSQSYTWIDGSSFRRRGKASASLIFPHILQNLDLAHPSLPVEAQSLFWKACKTQQGFLWFILVQAKCKQTNGCHQMVLQKWLWRFSGVTSGSHSCSLLLAVGTFLTAELAKQSTRTPQPGTKWNFQTYFTESDIITLNVTNEKNPTNETPPSPAPPEPPQTQGEKYIQKKD